MLVLFSDLLRFSLLLLDYFGLFLVVVELDVFSSAFECLFSDCEFRFDFFELFSYEFASFFQFFQWNELFVCGYFVREDDPINWIIDSVGVDQRDHLFLD